MKENKKTPVLFIIFNRPDTTKRVFEAIRKYKPKELFIAADGPRTDKPGEKERCEEARKITEKIDWPCEVKRLYRENNLGCKYAVSGAIDWFFKKVEEGIILEDDCLPDRSFFEFCNSLLSKYRDNAKIMHISGDNYLPHIKNVSNEYYFSRYPNIWGWATWKRAWNRYNVNIVNWREKISKNTFEDMSLIERTYWSNNFDMVSKNLIDTWDYQWVYTVFKYGYSIAPGSNLVTNIGHNKNATHASKFRSKSFKTGRIISSLKHPKKIYINRKNDSYVAKNVYYINVLMIAYQFLKIIGIIKIK